ncbi:MAG: iron ABC transporter permease, partial [Mesorhizobium sp.]
MSDGRRYHMALSLLCLATLILFCLSLLVGPAGIGFSDSVSALFSERRDAIALIMREIRLPRAL